MKSLENLWVELEEKVLLLCNLLVPVGNRLTDPICKRLANEGVADIDNPLTRHLLDITLIGEVLRNSRVLACKLKDMLDGRAFVVWACEVLDVIALEEQLLLCAEVYRIEKNSESL